MRAHLKQAKEVVRERENDQHQQACKRAFKIKKIAQKDHRAAAGVSRLEASCHRAARAQIRSGGVQQNLQWSRPNQQVKDKQKAGHVMRVKPHERENVCIRVALGFLAGLGAKGESLAEDHSLDSALDVNSAAGNAIPAKMSMNAVFVALKAK